MSATLDPQFAVDVAGVGLDGVQGDEQLLADLLIGTALCNQLQHTQFAHAEAIAAMCRLGRRRATGRELFQQCSLNPTGWQLQKLLMQPPGVLGKQRLERYQCATGRCGQAAQQQCPRLVASRLAQQQADLLGHGDQSKQFRPHLLSAPFERLQALLAGNAVTLQSFEYGTLQLDVLWQLWMAFRGSSAEAAVVGLRQAQQPRFGKVHAPLQQPQLAFGQGNHRQVVDRRHVPDVHQPFGLGEFGEGFGKAAGAAFHGGDHAVTDQHADVATGARLGQAGQQQHPPLVYLQAQGQQVALIQRQTRADRVQPNGGQAFEALLPLPYFLERAENFAPGLQDSGAVVMRQRLEQRIGDPLSQLQRITIQHAGAPQITVGDREVGQCRQAHQPLPIAFFRQAQQGFGAIALSLVTVSAAAGDDAAERQPLGEHGFLSGGRGRRQKPAQLIGQLFGGIQLAGQPQRPGVEHDQAGCAGQQVIRQIHLPAQQHADILFGQQLFFGEVLHQIGCHI
ncbi:Unknown protein sequence [Pseudomonas syringae pv. coryli]|uniref:Uncharacterized protein n=1 Tax=Pseudomonas syringae pv. coryli TaxID=317659 RepID=A0A0P9SI08_9PSED|nr:Unknown protein sequence [Pseudomonas syringae pv. coryli]